MMGRTLSTWLAGAVTSAVMAAVPVALTSQESGAAAATTTTAASETWTLESVGATTALPSTDALEAIQTDAGFSVAVVDVDSGAALSYGTDAFDTASIVKVDILAALVWQREQQGSTLTAAEQDLASVMITRSDNAAATQLFETVGGRAGLESFNQVIGLTDTEVGSNGNWGLTQTTATDQLRVLETVLGVDSVLSASGEGYVRGLMSDVIGSQNFGVSAAADDPAVAALKVGYLQRSTTGRWDVTSIGEIESAGHTYLVAILSDGSVTFEAGVDLVEEIARTAVAAMP